jgi:molecular chaperone IbpA
MIDLRDLNSLFIGWDKLYPKLVTINTFCGTSYPPYNLYRLDDDYIIELAVAGFGKEDLNITAENGSLTIKGTSAKQVEDRQFLHRGLASRSFTKTFALGDDIEVDNADLNDGILKIVLNIKQPEETKSKTINIGPSLLMEDDNG